nr:uncharacterized protein LOC125181710 [Anser cygnoides]
MVAILVGGHLGWRSGIKWWPSSRLAFTKWRSASLLAFAKWQSCFWLVDRHKMVAVGVVATILGGLATEKWRPSWLAAILGNLGVKNSVLGEKKLHFGWEKLDFEWEKCLLSYFGRENPYFGRAKRYFGGEKAACLGGLGGFWGDLFVFWACRDHPLRGAAADQTLRVYTCRGRALRLLRSARGRDVGWSILDVAFSPDASQCLYSSWSDYVYVYDREVQRRVLRVSPRGRGWGGRPRRSSGGPVGRYGVVVAP